jgi:hypothetical protein
MSKRRGSGKQARGDDLAVGEELRVLARGYLDYPKTTGRTIPVIALDPAG